MTVLSIEELEAFVAPFYASMDTMHDLTYIRRIRRKVDVLAQSYAGQIDQEILRIAVSFHGITSDHEGQVVDYLRASNRSRGVAGRAGGS